MEVCGHRLETRIQVRLFSYLFFKLLNVASYKLLPRLILTYQKSRPYFYEKVSLVDSLFMIYEINRIGVIGYYTGYQFGHFCGVVGSIIVSLITLVLHIELGMKSLSTVVV